MGILFQVSLPVFVTGNLRLISVTETSISMGYFTELSRNSPSSVSSFKKVKCESQSQTEAPQIVVSMKTEPNKKVVSFSPAASVLNKLKSELQLRALLT